MLAALRALVLELTAGWQALTYDALQFWHRDVAQLGIIGVTALALLLLTIRLTAGRRTPRAVAVPAILASFTRSRFAWLRHLPVLPAVLAIPFAVLAVADPYTALVSEQISFPGRRIR
jgi:hypothetical protein